MSEEQDDEGFIWETIKLINPSSLTTETQIRAVKKTIDDLLETGRRYHNGMMESKAVWLYCQSEEEGPRRAVVVDGKSEIAGTEFDSPLLGDYGFEMNLAIRRGKWESEPETHGINYEDPAGAGGSDVISVSGIGDNGAKWVIGNAKGTLPQRIEFAQLTSNTSSLMYQAWLGIRPVYNGTAGFQPLWGGEYVNTDGIDSDVGAISGAHGGQGMRIHFRGSAELAQRGTLYYSNIQSSNHDDLAGRYMVLARLAVSAATTECAFKLCYGSGGAQSNVGEVYVTSDSSIGTSWRLFEMGEIQIPGAGRRAAYDTYWNGIRQTCFTIWAERLSAAGSLYLDYLLLIPSEHMVKFDSGYLGGPDVYYANVDPDDKQYGLGWYMQGVAGGDAYMSLVDTTPSFHNWAYPVGGGVLVMAAQANIHNLGHSYNIAMRLIPRWTSYRTE